MLITMTIPQFCGLLLTIGGLFIMFYLVKLIKRLIKMLETANITLEKTNDTLDDAKGITNIVKTRTEKVDQAIDNTVSKITSYKNVSKIVKNVVKKNKEEVE